MEKVDLFKALSNETRLEIINLLKKESLCACKILEDIDLSQSTVSHHMKILADSGIVNCRKEGKWHHYSLNYDTLKTLEFFFKDLVQDKTILGGRCSCDS
ncbi:MAG TPA: metalloregulator ArsR/SmtB family transcription factor [Clostridia bacterium]|nr:metalloregulator ArsR/SmtB family transcription factor [Clostridia bacterium]